MRILLVHNFYRQPGGEDAVVGHEQALLEAHGHQVRLFGEHNDGIGGPWDQATTALNLVYNRGAKRRLAEAIADFRPDVMHVHNFFPRLSPSVFDAAGEAGVASVMTLHNFRILCPTAFLYHDDQVRERSLSGSCWWTVPRRVYRGSLLGTLALANMVETHKRRGTWRRKVDRFIALTPYARRKFIEGGLPEGRIAVKGNSVSAGASFPPAGPRHGALFVGRLSTEKGVGVLMEAWRDLDYPLRIVGDGPLAEQIGREAGPSIALLGRLAPEAVRREMEQAAFLVLPSVWNEMFPMVAVEAMAAGLPALVSRLEGLTSIVEDGTTGAAFPVGDAAALRETVAWAIGHPDRLAELGLQARERYMARHTPGHNYDCLMQVYADAIAEKAQARPGSGSR